MATQFSSEGFDLDAMPSSDDTEKDKVVYEVGGSATVEAVARAKSKEKDDDDDDKEVSPIAKSEELKAQGNEEFKQQNFLEAHDMYTAAIEACPGMTGEELLQLRDEHDEKERQKLYERNRLDNEARRRRHQQAEGDEETTTEESNGKKDEARKPEEFKAPPHTYGEKLAIYHNNRAACSLHLKSYDDAAKDCDIDILLNPLYSKAYVRRSLAYEKLDKTELALADGKKALELDPKNASLRKTVARLQKIEDERLEKLKEETIGKLKDLGNSILGNFGLSIDNFQTVQDPNTGSYSIQFDNSKK